MWSRRAFLQHSSLAVAAMSSLDALAASPARGPLNKLIGIQVYTVREAVAKDPEGTLKQLAKIGYREVEFAGGPPLRPVPELRAIMADNSLTCPAIHTSMAEMQTTLDESIELAKALAAQTLVCAFPWTADSRFATDAFRTIASDITLDDWTWNADQLNRAGEKARKAGIRMGYHNHNMEFRKYNGVVGFDELLRLTDPALVTIELDIGWVVTAGADPAHYLTKHADRVSLLHIKDVRRDVQATSEELKAQTTEVGSGKVDWKALFKVMDPARIKHYFVEQENFERPPLEAAKICFDYLSNLQV